MSNPDRESECIDIHSHYFEPGFPEFASAVIDAPVEVRSEPCQPGTLNVQGRRGDFLAGELANLQGLEARLEMMDGAGITMQVLSPPTFFLFYDQDPATGVRLTERLNDGIMEAVESYPNRFLGFASVPMQAGSSAIAELERVAQHPGIRGLAIGSSVAGRPLDDRSLWDVFEAAEGMEMPVFIHPTYLDLAGSDRMQEYFLHNLIGIPANTTLAASRLIFSGALERFPSLSICLTHGGGYLAWAIGRLVRAFETREECRVTLSVSPEELIRRFYVDTIVHSSEALSFILSTFGDDRVVIGTDYPFRIGDSDPLEQVAGADLTEHARHLLKSANAASFLGL